MQKILLPVLCLLFCLCATAQPGKIVSGKVFDVLNKGALQGAIVTDAHLHTASTDAEGRFRIVTEDHLLTVTFNGYQSSQVVVLEGVLLIALAPANQQLQEVVVSSASRTVQKRSEAPIAIATISQQMIQDTKATRLDYLVNKVSGVFMVNLGNEQHEMSIRQPMTTRSLFLYLEDGVPIRATGIYNHNALLEMNMAAARQIEIIKGPASSLYGAEAIGGAVNVITQAPPAIANGMISVQGSNNGYKRVDAQGGSTFGKLGLLVSGYYANRHDGPVEQTDFHKSSFTVRGDYVIDERTTWSNSLTYVDFYSDMGGGSLDSTHFARKDYSSLYGINYRKTNAFRFRSQLNRRWGNGDETQVTVAYRNNSVKQNPSYYVTNNPANMLLANGQVNNSSFNSYMLMAQHVRKMNWLNSKLIVGVSTDISPSTYVAQYIRINRDSSGKYSSYNKTDSMLSNYATNIRNLASFASLEASPVIGLKVVASGRFDYYHYDFINALPGSAATGAPNTISTFTRFTPKVGVTYNYHSIGFYGNYSQGYVPPQITELFNSVKVPYLKPQTFFNYEVGGWIGLWKNKLYADYSLYLLRGTNEIISVRLGDGSYQNQNAGKTKHQGIEYGITYKPTASWTLRLSATNAKHTFIEDVEKGQDYSGHEMAGGPHFIANAEVTYKPVFVRGLRVSAEWQHQGSYYMDNANSGRYPGFDVFNVRIGYVIGRFEVWENSLNVLNKYYATLASKSTYGYTYSLGDQREFSLGVSFHLGK